MNLTSRTLSAALMVIALATPAAAQQAPGPGGRGGQGVPGGRGGRFGGVPPRDNAQAPTGTAKISGRVVASDTGTPIRRAQISITSRDAQFNRNLATDDDGLYEVAALPAGRYRLFVNKAGFVTLEYGQARPFEAGKPLDITTGQVLERVDFSLPRGSAITGRITDEFGDPITDAQVQALRYQYVNGERQLVDAGRIAQTDDLGAYRIFGLMPGDYIVRASMRPNMAPGPRGTEAEQTGYPGTYYPGVSDVAQAQTVTAALGQEVSSIGFPLVPARLSRVSGTVVGSDGRPLGGAVVMIRMRGGPGAGSMRMNMIGNIGGGQVRPDGSFQLTNVPPGEYVLEVQERPQNARNVQDVTMAQLEFASMPVSVSGGDVDNVAVMTTPGVTASGRVAYQGQAAPKQTLQVIAAPPAGAPPPGMLMNVRARGGGRVAEDGTFEIRGLAGPQMIRVQNVPAGWALKSISLNGADITDAPYDFRPGSNVTGLVITLTDRLTEVTGMVRDARGQPLMDYVIVAFPEDTKLWGAQSRYVQTTRPNQNGTFSLKGLPSGRYLAAVVPALENGLQNDPAILQQLRARAQSFSVAEGQTLNLNLEMTAQ